MSQDPEFDFYTRTIVGEQLQLRLGRVVRGPVFSAHRWPLVPGVTDRPGFGRLLGVSRDIARATTNLAARRPAMFWGGLSTLALGIGYLVMGALEAGERHRELPTSVQISTLPIATPAPQAGVIQPVDGVFPSPATPMSPSTEQTVEIPLVPPAAVSTEAPAAPKVAAKPAGSMPLLSNHTSGPLPATAPATAPAVPIAVAPPVTIPTTRSAVPAPEKPAVLVDDSRSIVEPQKPGQAAVKAQSAVLQQADKLAVPLSEKPAVAAKPAGSSIQTEAAPKLTVVHLSEDGRSAFITNPKTRLPQSFSVGDRLPDGKTLQRIDVGAGTITADGVVFKME